MSVRRAHGVVARPIGDELLVFDAQREDSFVLDGAPARAFAEMDGGVALDAELTEHGPSAVAELLEHDLVEVDEPTRRLVLQRAGAVGAIVAAGSVLRVAAATPAFAASNAATTTKIASPTGSRADKNTAKTFTATTTQNGSTAVPVTGSVMFSANPSSAFTFTDSQPVPLDGNNQASISGSATTNRTFTIYATFTASPAGSFQSSTGSYSCNVG